MRSRFRKRWRYADVAAVFATARWPGRGKPIANNTRLHQRGQDYALRLHWTDVVTWHPDETMTLDTGGWHTQTTSNRISSATGIPIYSYHSQLHLPDGSPLDGQVRVHWNGWRVVPSETVSDVHREWYRNARLSWMREFEATEYGQLTDCRCQGLDVVEWLVRHLTHRLPCTHLVRRAFADASDAKWTKAMVLWSLTGDRSEVMRAVRRFWRRHAPVLEQEAARRRRPFSA